jgi:Mn-dependent DtxR family transcriptional regulator
MYESAENYLETILMIHDREGFARSIDVANHLGVSRPSVSRAIASLKDAGYLEIGVGGALLLTETGSAAAKKVAERHWALTDFLVATAGVDRKRAEDNACRIEHIIDDEVFTGITRFMEGRNAS